MSIWCSTGEVKCIDYGASHIYPWERKLSTSASTVDFAVVYDYVYDPEKCVGDKLMPYLRMSAQGPDSWSSVVLTEAGARKMVDELNAWLARSKRQPGRRRALISLQSPSSKEDA